MGLLDYFNQGADWLKNQPQMADPHANARALMGGQAMQYNQQPQSLIASQTPQVNNPTDQSSFTPQPPTAQQTQQMTYQGTPQAGVNYPNFDPSAINPYLDGDQTGTVGGYVNNGQNVVNENFNNRVTQPQTGSLLMGSPEAYQKPSEYESDEIDYSKVGVNSNVPQTTPYPAPPSIIGETFDPSMTEEERRLREEAASRLPWYLGGKR